MIPLPGSAARPQELTNSCAFGKKAVTDQCSWNLRRVSVFPTCHSSVPSRCECFVPSSKRLRETLDRLAAAEERAFAREFLAPMLRRGVVQVRIAGVVCRLEVSPHDFEGWGIFRPTSTTAAELVRPARLAERRQYLDLLPILRMIICLHEGDHWLAMPAHRADTRFRIEGLVPVRLVEEAQLFEVLITRFDGAQCW